MFVGGCVWFSTERLRKYSKERVLNCFFRSPLLISFLVCDSEMFMFMCLLNLKVMYSSWCVALLMIGR